MNEPDAPEPEAKPVKHEIVPAQVIPDFRPVPRETDRHDGWTADVQRRFVEALADTGSVTAAARTVGRAARGAYELRRHPEAGEFRHAWNAALDIAVRLIEDGVMDRAINGVQVPVYAKGGELAGWRTVHNEHVTTFILKHRAPERFGGMRRSQGAKGDNAIDKMELNRLRKQWRQEWEKERFEQDAARHREHGETLAQMFTGRHVRWWTGLSPRAREAYLQFRRIESEDMHLDHSQDPIDEADCPALHAEYQATCPTAGLAPIDKIQEADGLADEAVLGGDLPEPPQTRLITLTDQGGWAPFDPRRNDGRAREWP